MISGNVFHPNVDEWLTHERGLVKSGNKLYVDFEYLHFDNTGRQAFISKNEKFQDCEPISPAKN